MESETTTTTLRDHYSFSQIRAELLREAKFQQDLKDRLAISIEQSVRYTALLSEDERATLRTDFPILAQLPDTSEIPYQPDHRLSKIGVLIQPTIVTQKDTHVA